MSLAGYLGGDCPAFFTADPDCRMPSAKSQTQTLVRHFLIKPSTAASSLSHNADRTLLIVAAVRTVISHPILHSSLLRGALFYNLILLRHQAENTAIVAYSSLSIALCRIRIGSEGTADLHL